MDQNRKKTKFRDKNFVERSTLGAFFGVFRLRFTLKILFILGALEHTRFYPKWGNMASIKRHYIKNTTYFLENIMEDVKLMPDKMLKVLRRHLLSFSSYGLNLSGNRGGAVSPPSVAMLSEL